MVVEIKHYTIDDDIIQVRSPYFGGFANFYALRRPDGFDLVDSGADFPGFWDQVADLFRQLHPDGPAAIKRVFLTHAHQDHMGLADLLQREYGTPCFATAAEAGYLATRRRMQDADLAQWFGRHGPPEQVATKMGADFPKPPAPLPVVQPLPEPLVIGSHAWREIPTPGHSPAHVCFYQPEKRLLFAGDHIFAQLPPAVNTFPSMDRVVLSEYLNSLNALEPLAVDLALPGHGQPFREVGAALARARATVTNEREAVLTALAAKADTAYGVAQRLFRKPSRPAASFGDLGRAVSYLQYLGSQGLAREEHQIWHLA